MNVATWAQARHLAEYEQLSVRAIARRLHCSRHTVAAALASERPPDHDPSPRASLLDPHKPKIAALIAKDPDLSAVRVHEEIARDGFTGSAVIVRRYLHAIRPPRGRVYQEVHYEPAQAMQVDWGECGTVKIGNTTRKVSVFVAVLCHSRMLHIEFTLSQRKAEFQRALVGALEFFGGSPRAVIVDNLKAAVLEGSGRSARFHPEFLALCGTYCLQPIACAARDPESKGLVEAGVRYVKHNALAGRAEELTRFEDYQALAPRWRDQVANVRIHEATRERPIDRFAIERPLLRALPAVGFDTDEVVSAIVTPHARVEFDGNRYSTPPEYARRPVLIRASREALKVWHEGRLVAEHARSYQRGQLIVATDHRAAALLAGRRFRRSALERECDALGPEAQQFHLRLRGLPVKIGPQLRRVLDLGRLYGRTELLAALSSALELPVCDAGVVENLLLAARRRRQLPTPTLPTPERRELIDEITLDPADPAYYERFCTDTKEEDTHGAT